MINNNNTFNDIYLKLDEIQEEIIYKVFDKNENEFYALKIIKDKKDYQKVIDLLKNIKSKYVVKLKEYFYDKSNESYCIIMELCDCDLRQILNKYKPNGLPLYMINKIFHQLNDALQAMRKLNFTHRDLKPENILIKYLDHNKDDFDIRLTDFELSSNEINSSINEFSYTGTKDYMAPEMDTRNYNNKCDLWSLGVILYELYTNKYIFYSNNSIEINVNKYTGKIIKETDNEQINKLLKKLIEVDIQKRIQWEEYFNDDFFINYNEIYTSPNDQIIYIKFKINNNNEEIKVLNDNTYINKENIKYLILNEYKEYNELKNLNKGIYNIIIKMNQNFTNCENMFRDCENILEIIFIRFDTKDVVNMKGMFSNCSSLEILDVSKFDTKNVIDMSRMFSDCSSLKNLDITNFDTKNVDNMRLMFYNCGLLEYLDVSKFDTKNVTDMFGMFWNCSSLNHLVVKNFDTKNVTNLSGMFNNCSSLENLDVSKFDTKKVKFMSYMFNECSSLENIVVNNFNTENVSDMSYMFNECSSLENINVNNFNTENVSDMSYMFNNCTSLKNLDVSKFDTKNVTKMNNMFNNCSSLENISDMSLMFNSCSSLKNLDDSKINVTTISEPSSSENLLL